jgi:hypothetical protein
VLAIFLLAMVSALGLIIGSNGLYARKSARTASYRAAAVERAALATWMAADALEHPQKSSLFLFSNEGRDLTAAISAETGRIDLNGLSPGGLAQAIQELGFEPRRAEQAAAILSTWRGPVQPDPSHVTAGLPDARRALWSIDDLDAVTQLESGVRDCLKLWGTAHARGTFMHTSPDQPLSLVSEIGDAGNIMVGSMVRITVLDQFTGMRFRSILLYSGGRTVNGSNASPWWIMEWLSPDQDVKCEATT